MPVIVKTPALPVTIALPERGVRGTWHLAGTRRDIAATYTDTHGQVAGFALTGAACGRKPALTRELDRYLAAKSQANENDDALIATRS
jgi:rubredoxin-NAD+ reductase